MADHHMQDGDVSRSMTLEEWNSTHGNRLMTPEEFHTALGEAITDMEYEEYRDEFLAAHAVNNDLPVLDDDLSTPNSEIDIMLHSDHPGVGGDPSMPDYSKVDWSQLEESNPFAPEKWAADLDFRQVVAIEAHAAHVEIAAPAQAVPPKPAVPEPESPMTFGVELEFFGFYKVLRQFQKFEDPEIISRNGSGYVLIPSDGDESTALNSMIQSLRDQGLDLNDYDEDQAVPVPPPGAPPATRYSANSRDPIYHRWTLRWDSSLSLTAGVDGHMAGTGVDPWIRTTCAMPLELISPAMRATPESFQEVMRVVNLVKQQFKMHINPSCGMHVHVGMGPDRIGPAPLRRMACLIWTIDAIMNEIHPSHRHANNQCARNRQHCQLARGMTAADAMDDVLSRFDPIQDISIDEGLDELKKCTTSGQIGRLMYLHYMASAAYQFDSYYPLGRTDVEDEAKKPTIEFRQAAGSINPDWIARWIYICVRVCEWAAVDMDWNLLDQVALRCNYVEANPQTYAGPLREFLDAIGCGDPADYIESTTHDQRVNMAGPTVDPRPSPPAFDTPTPIQRPS
ncbi:putative Amidoligase enzyme-domain-containing protein [Seiridium cardinale]